ncbi:DUF58 domain-containing protein [Granulosicoccus antarcticus]|uniref:DUF58 domain-containing protein n=1 Tax=Granulosicoccus antarcticus IMCC3135 TaxID=1192854 RepID=A0A2Z2NW41_9GAMM|nr:DUF58 domain-containing protein [Granulosicoccus antarcticus]ASJ75676.1 hypothetical protein IMCC3135_28120 [Granulosicoccus antarcticus IMCC3135]
MKPIAQPNDYGVVASVHELVRARPDRAVTGFAPGGKVSTHQFGTNHSVFRGRGMEFDESRLYQPGDDNRSIDWRVTARTGKVHTKLYREERERPVYVLIDCRRMMQFGSRVRFKSVLAAHMASMLCWVGIDDGDRVGGFLLTPTGLKSFPASRSRSSMLAFLHAISDATQIVESSGNSTQAEENSEPSLAHALVRLRKACLPGTLAFVITDFSDFDAAAETELKRLSVRAHVTNLLVYDPLDAKLPTQGDYRVSDGNQVLSLEQLNITQSEAHEMAFATRKERVAQLSRQRSMAFLSVSTADKPESVLHPHRKHARRAHTLGASS